MVVYWEYAFAENCILDGLMLYLALKIARGKVSFARLLFAACVGGAEAVLFPLVRLPVWAAYIVKIAGGVVLALLAVKRGTWKTYVMVAVSFFALTFALGGLLTAAYSFFGVEYAEGTGYLVERAPVALVLSFAGAFAAACIAGARALYRYAAVRRHILTCSITAGGKTVRWKGLEDSGNLLTFRGEPVNVVSAIGALALFGKGAKPVGSMTVGTVNGSRETPVFRCERLEADCGGKKVVRENALLTVGALSSKEYSVLLHSGFSEVSG